MTTAISISSGEFNDDQFEPDDNATYNFTIKNIDPTWSVKINSVQVSIGDDGASNAKPYGIDIDQNTVTFPQENLGPGETGNCTVEVASDSSTAQNQLASGESVEIYFQVTVDYSIATEWEYAQLTFKMVAD